MFIRWIADSVIHLLNNRGQVCKEELSFEISHWLVEAKTPQWRIIITIIAVNIIIIIIIINMTFFSQRLWIMRDTNCDVAWPTCTPRARYLTTDSNKLVLNNVWQLGRKIAVIKQHTFRLKISSSPFDVMFTYLSETTVHYPNCFVLCFPSGNHLFSVVATGSLAFPPEY